jgi:hypothetical protein
MYKNVKIPMIIDLFKYKIVCKEHIFIFNSKEEMQKKYYEALCDFCAAILDCEKNDLYFINDFIGQELVYRIMSGKPKGFKNKSK